MKNVEKMVRVRFDQRSLDAGFNVALTSSSVTFTEKPNEFIIPEGSVRLLRERKIPFDVITDVTG